MPVLRTQKYLKTLRAGDRLAVLADDPLAALDIANLCREEGHLLIESRSRGGETGLLIEVGKDS